MRLDIAKTGLKFENLGLKLVQPESVFLDIQKNGGFLRFFECRGVRMAEKHLFSGDFWGF